MTKRAEGKFQRNLADFYATPPEAVLPLLPHLDFQSSGFAEPCCGDGSLVNILKHHGLTCRHARDLIYGENALDLKVEDLQGADVIITNPPYTREVMHALIAHLPRLAPTWLLIELDWFATVQSALLARMCSDIVPIGRIRWIPGSPSVGFDNYVWAKFTHNNTLTRFHPRRVI